MTLDEMLRVLVEGAESPDAPMGVGVVLGFIVGCRAMELDADVALDLARYCEQASADAGYCRHIAEVIVEG